MIDTLTQSTKAYLALLEQTQGGTERHLASHIEMIPDGFEPIENRAWPVITCVLPHHLKFPLDSGATLVPTGHPGRGIPAQILAYDPTSGRAKIAVKENPPDATGHLVIDFKWLIRRLIQWLEIHGTNIGNPFRLAGHPPAISEFSNVGEMSDEQIASAGNLLGNPVAYVWGPPGTGKTRHVLAETVAHLIRQRKRVLVTAATNLAVDNALDAILRVNGVQKEDVLRIGVPTSVFRNQWPECCESRAFDQEMAQLQQRLNFLRARLNATQRRAELSERLSCVTAEVLQTEAALDTAEREVARLNEECDRVSAELTKLDLLCGALREQLNETRQALDELALASKENEISILEREQTSLMGKRQEAESQIADLRWWEKLFTRRKEQLSQRRESAARSLDSVEATLHSKRKSYNQASQEGRALEGNSAELKGQLSTQEEGHRDQASHFQGLTLERTATAERREAVDKRNHDAKVELAAIQEELMQIAAMDALPTDQNQIDALTVERDRVQTAMAEISQDLSDKLVLGMTLDGFVGLTMDKSLHFDHVIVDEAGYAPLAKVIPLCSLHCPISLLGDHCQLPPVYEGDHHVESECYWGTSALYLEDAFDPEIGTSFEALLERSKRPPRFENLHRSQLTRSYRFGPTLADLLDRHFYEIGLCSHAPAPTSIEVIDCPPRSTPLMLKRQNPGECVEIVERVGRWLDWRAEDQGTLAVLSPYRNQVKLLRDALWNRFSEHPAFDAIDVLTVNKAQGREWDTVFFSASDTRELQGNSPFLSDTAITEGRLVVNTAISRAKKHLRIFCDREFWALRQFPESLLSEISMQPKPLAP